MALEIPPQFDSSAPLEQALFVLHLIERGGEEFQSELLIELMRGHLESDEFHARVRRRVDATARPHVGAVLAAALQAALTPLDAPDDTV